MGGCLASCIGTMAGSCLASCCSCELPPKQARIPYVVLFFIMAIVALCLKYWGSDLVIHFYYWSIQFCGESCLGNQVIYRTSFSLMALHVSVIISILFTIKYHTGMWLAKLLLFFSFLISSFFMPNNVFHIYAEICRYVSFLFLVFQIIALIDFGYVVC